MRRIAIIEDNAEINNLIRKILEAENYFSSQFFNGQEVLDQLDEILSHDIILLDVMLPVVDGIEIYNKISGLKPEALNKILFLTAKSDSETLRFFTDNHCKFITKPFDPYEFLNVLKDFS